MKQSTCGAVFCQPGGDELKHDMIKRSPAQIGPVMNSENPLERM